MPIAAWAIVALGMAGVYFAVVHPRVQAARARAAVRDECQGLANAISTLRTQGGDAAEGARLESQLRACVAKGQALGVDFDAAAFELDACVSRLTQIKQEFQHFRSTEYSDPVKRNNTRSAILRLGAELSACLRQAFENATTDESLAALESLTNEALTDSNARRLCYKNDEPGCGRFAVNEEHGNDKARAELNRIGAPLAALLEEIRERRLELAGAQGEAERARRPSLDVDPSRGSGILGL